RRSTARCWGRLGTQLCRVLRCWHRTSFRHCLSFSQYSKLKASSSRQGDGLMAEVQAALGGAGLRNVHVREYVRHWAGLTGAARIEVISASDDTRLVGEALADGEILPAGEGRYYARSHVKDTARSEERTIVATSNPADKGAYNNWRPAAEMRPLLEERMRGASAGKTMYVVPYLMAPPGSPLEAYATGVELTDARTVVLHMIRMARVGVEH